MGDWRFGDKIRIEEHMERIIKHPSRLVSTDLQIIMRECYEKAYGIYNHGSVPEDHFALVKHHASEDAISFSRMRERLEAFVTNKLGAALNMSFTEFLNQPSYLCDFQIEVISSIVPEGEEELRKVLEELRKSDKERNANSN